MAGSGLGYDPSLDPRYNPPTTSYTTGGYFGGTGTGYTSWADQAKSITPYITNTYTTENWGVDLNVIDFGESAGFLTWSKNPQAVPVILIGDTTGSVVRATSVDGMTASGSPVTLDQMIQRLRREYGTKPGEVLKLKQQLAALSYYGGKEAQASISYGDIWDNSLTSAVITALWTVSATNHDAAIKDPSRKKFLSLKDFLSQGKKNPGLFNGGGGSGGGGGSSTRTSIVKQTFNPEDYDIAVDELFQRTVGRGASKEELDYFVKQLQTYADANPQTTVTKITGDTQTSTTTGGLNNERAMSMLREQAVNTPGAEQYNKATKYLDYFMNALGSPIKLG